MTSSPRPTALVLRALYLGDMITGLPALRLLRTSLPGYRIVLAAPAGVGELALGAGVVDDLTPALELAPLDHAPRGAEVAVDLHGNGPESRALLEATGARRIIAYSGGSHVWDGAEHEVERWCRLVGEAFGVERSRWPGLAGQLPRPDPPIGLAGATVIHPGAKARARQWPPERFVAVARAWARRGHRVVVTGGRGERGLAEKVADAADTVALTALSLPELLGLIAHARLVVCGDTGIAHVASVFATPSVVLFGPVPPTQWGPPPDRRHRALWPATDHRGDPHGDRPDPVLLSITVDDVVAAVDAVEAGRAH